MDLRGLSRRKLTVILVAAGTFVLATWFEVATGRDDWPFSRYPMYSDLKGPLAERFVLVGVAAGREFVLSDEQTAPFTGSRLNVTNKKLESKPVKQRQFLVKIRDRYQRRRAGAGWPEIEAVRAYHETWTISPGLRGMDKPHRKLTGSTEPTPERSPAPSP